MMSNEAECRERPSPYSGLFLWSSLSPRTRGEGYRAQRGSTSVEALLNAKCEMRTEIIGRAPREPA